MYLDRAVLELQAGLLKPANYPRLAAEGIAAGHDGEVLRLMFELIGERQTMVIETAATILDIEARLLGELSVPERTRAEAAWELARMIAANTLRGEFSAWDGAIKLTALARATDDAALIDEATRLEGTLDQWQHIPPDERDTKVLDEMRRIVALLRATP